MSSSQTSHNSRLWTASKLAACAAIVATIAVVFSTFGSSESQADIAWLSSVERSQSERFDAALENLGHDEVERYDLDGNTVYFSAHSSYKRPRQLMVEYQEEFRRQGLNDRVFTGIVDSELEDRIETSLTGGLAPLAVSDHHVTLGGVVTANEAGDADDLRENLDAAEEIHDLFRAHRYIEITRSPDQQRTTVVATWSDDAFDYRRMDPLAGEGDQGYDTIVPSCPGCVRLSRFADDNPGHIDRRVLSFLGPRSIEDTRRFYAETLAARGWERESMDAALDVIAPLVDLSLPDATTDRYRRGDEELMLTFTTDDRTGESLTFAAYSGS